MKFNRREKISFECACIIEDIQVNFSEKTNRKYAKIISITGSCFLCFSERIFLLLCERLKEEKNIITSISGEVEQKRGGTYLVARRFNFAGKDELSSEDDQNNAREDDSLHEN
jgi:hypothetical protein